MRSIAIWLTLQVLIAVAPSEAMACVCGVSVPPTRAERLEAVRREMATADAVFVGEYVSTDGQAVTLRVIKSWKGTEGRTVRLRSAVRVISGDRIQVDNCALSVEPGEFLIFASKSPDGVMSASKCPPTGKVDQRRELVDLLDEIVRGRTP